MVKFFTKMMCVAMLFALCAWSLNAQDESSKVQIKALSELNNAENPATVGNGDAPPPVRERASVKEMVKKSTAERPAHLPTGGKPSVAPPLESRKPVLSENRKITTPSPGGRGPTTTAYGVDYFSASAVSIPLNNPSGMGYIGGSIYDMMCGGDWIDGEWYATTFDDYYGGYILKIDP
jgi:hypothetical protein